MYKNVYPGSTSLIAINPTPAYNAGYVAGKRQGSAQAEVGHRQMIRKPTPTQLTLEQKKEWEAGYEHGWNYAFYDLQD